MKIKVTASRAGQQQGTQQQIAPEIIATLELTPLDNLVLDANNLRSLKPLMEHIALMFCVGPGVPVTTEITFIDQE